uniref:Uncharacterized protein n=1 Tax=Tanacetum cinerariifolium TaxID=118510 RepID=A0A6L2KS65_TANCI|nr:uncharacterized protein [Tanacetum cinerariifolium]
MSINSGDHTGSKTASKAAMLSCSTQSKPLLFLDQLEVDVTGTIVVMIGRVWDVNAVTGCYLSTDFVVSDSKGNMIHCTAKSSVAYNFLRLKEGDIVGYVTNVGQTSYTKTGSKTLEFYLANQRGQLLWVTLWGELRDVLVENKIKHTGFGAMVLTGMSGKEYNNKSYLSSTSSMVFCDDDDIQCLQELKADDSCAAPSKAPLAIDCSQPREGTLENLLIWARNRQNNTVTFHYKVMIKNFRTKKGWNYPYRLKVAVTDNTVHTIVVMFNDTATELLKCSAESLMEKEKIIPNASAEDCASSSTAAVTANDVESPGKIVTKPPTVYTPLKPNEGKKQKGHAFEDSDVDEVSGPQENTRNSNAKVVVDTQKKRKRGLFKKSVSIRANTIIGPGGRVQSYMDNASRNTQGMTPSFTDILQNSVRIQANIIIRQDGRVKSYCGIRLTETATDYLGPTHLRKDKKGSKKAAFISAGVPVMYYDIGPPTHQCRNFGATMWYEEREESHDQPSTAEFRDNIRVYNNMFSFTLFGAKIDNSINTGRAPYTFRINGQNYHRMGSLLPAEGMPSKFAQLYFFDTQNEDARNAACTNDGKCSKHFPKPFLAETFLDEDGYPHYRRRDNKVTFKKGKFMYDNKYVVPHNRNPLLKYKVHINVEWCNRSRAIKYLFKYLNKGPYIATIVIEENVRNETTLGTENVLKVDEIKNYLNCWFLAPCEAVWRLFSFDINYAYPSVKQLSFHLPNQNAITLRDSEKLPALLQKEGIDVTMFTDRFELNKCNTAARTLTYADIPKHYVWHGQSKQ